MERNQPWPWGTDPEVCSASNRTQLLVCLFLQRNKVKTAPFPARTRLGSASPLCFGGPSPQWARGPFCRSNPFKSIVVCFSLPEMAQHLKSKPSRGLKMPKDQKSMDFTRTCAQVKTYRQCHILRVKQADLLNHWGSPVWKKSCFGQQTVLEL